MYLLGYDIGSSAIKAAVIDTQNGEIISNAYSPSKEMEIKAVKSGWGEQDPNLWWKQVVNATRLLLKHKKINPKDIKGIGISYQMHGLVVVDRNRRPLRDAIIWCDSRAVEIGDLAFARLGRKWCLKNLLNSPGNFTASKLKWIKENEPKTYSKIYKMMLPGDYIAMRMTDKIATTKSGLSEGMMWNYSQNRLADKLLKYYGISEDLVSDVVPTFGFQGELTRIASNELGLSPGIPVSYRAGDQPNNAFSLNVLHPGEVAATAGTSGVIYGVGRLKKYEPLSRVNTFLHVNHTPVHPSYGVLLCINGTGSLYHWLKKTFQLNSISDGYARMDEMAGSSSIGAGGLTIIPFGNGAERMLENENLGAQILGLSFNSHTINNVMRASQEGIACSFQYGFEIMKRMGVKPKTIRVGKTNMFRSRLFCEILTNLTGAVIERYNTDGAVGAARGAGVGSGVYKKLDDAFVGLTALDSFEPDSKLSSLYRQVYHTWSQKLKTFL